MRESIASKIEEWSNRPIYKDLTVEIIDSTPDDDLMVVVFDSLIENLLPDDYEYTRVMSLHPSRRAVYLIQLLEGEVNNGGFNQFYFNASGAFYHDLPEALRLIGADKFAELTERANALYEQSKAEITKTHDGTLQGFMDSYKDNPLDAMDDEFYALNESDSLTTIQIEFVRQHKADFVGSGGTDSG